MSTVERLDRYQRDSPLHISLQALPFGQHLTRIDTGRDGITVHADGSSVVISTGN